MRLFRTLLIALATLIVAGTIASAAPGVRGDVEPEPTPTTAPDPSETPSPEPVTSETVPPEGETEGEGISAVEGFAACDGLTGLENAICRHEALLVTHPDNPGLANSLAHLNANLLAHAEEEVAEEPVEGETETEGGTETETTEETSACPGKSCEPHGNGKGHSG